MIGVSRTSRASRPFAPRAPVRYPALVSWPPISTGLTPPHGGTQMFPPQQPPPPAWLNWQRQPAGHSLSRPFGQVGGAGFRHLKLAEQKQPPFVFTQKHPSPHLVRPPCEQPGQVVQAGLVAACAEPRLVSAGEAHTTAVPAPARASIARRDNGASQHSGTVSTPCPQADRARLVRCWNRTRAPPPPHRPFALGDPTQNVGNGTCRAVVYHSAVMVTGASGLASCEPESFGWRWGRTCGEVGIP